jgi:hypothetical protein
MVRKMMALVILRKCQHCGLEAHNEEELEKFTKAKHYEYGRRNICKSCFAKILRKGGVYHEGHVNSCANWVNENKQQHEEMMHKRITFKGRRVYLKENPRTGVCVDCGTLISAKQDRQGPMHHERYNDEDPEDGTTERCDACHTRFHDAQRKEAIAQGRRKGWNEP